MVATIVASGSYFSRFRISQSGATATVATTRGHRTRATAKASAGPPGTHCPMNQASTAPSMKNSPCATLTTRMMPKVRLRPTAVSARTADVTSPSITASKSKGPNCTKAPMEDAGTMLAPAGSDQSA